MIAIYKDLSDLDAERITYVVDSLEKVFDEDKSGTVGRWNSDSIALENVEVVLDINEFIRGFVLTTKGDLQSKIEYTFRIYDQNNDQKISGEEIKKMANVMIWIVRFSRHRSVRSFVF